MSEEVTISTWYLRPLTRTEIQVFTFVGDERKAIMLSKFIVLPENATYEQIDEAVKMAFMRLKVLVDWDPNVEVVNAKRRDKRNGTLRPKSN
jgi:hypothetical protein